LQTKTEAEVTEVSIKQQRKIRMGGKDKAKAGSRRNSDLNKQISCASGKQFL
jgi:hypothetical protein